MITITAFAWVPEFAQGYVKDFRVRWALEEAGLPYCSRLLRQGDQDQPDYRAIQPFGQVPVFEEDGITMFESGAIVLHIGQRCAQLLPTEPGARARATHWLVSALNSVEPFVAQLVALDVFYKDEPWGSVLREIADTGMLDAPLSAYVERCLARPAFTRAIDAQMRDFKGSGS